MKAKSLYETEVYRNDYDSTLTVYKAKKSKNIYLLSSIYKTVSIDESHRKRLPETEIPQCYKIWSKYF